MTCPTCGRLAWPYDDDTLTCKDGHRTAHTGARQVTHEAEAEIDIETRIRIPWTAVIAAGAYFPEIVRLFT